MSILVLVDVEAAPGRADELAAVLVEITPDTRAQDGCESITLHRDQDDPTHVVAVERWTARERHEAYMRWRAQRGDAERLGPLMAGPPVIRYLDNVGE